MASLRLLLGTLALTLLCVLPTQAASASTNPSSHHKHSRLCKRSRYHHRHPRICGSSAKRKAKHTHSHLASSALIELPGTSQQAAVPSDSVATIASVLATPCANAGLIPSGENVQLIREATVCLINQERARNGEDPLQVNERLEQAAQSHTNNMVSENYFNHVAPDGETPLQRVQATGYLTSQTYSIGENVGWATLGLATPQAMVEAWIASPDHLANILESKYRDTAIGIVPSVPASYSEGNPGAIYTQEFGFVEG